MKKRKKDLETIYTAASLDVLKHFVSVQSFINNNRNVYEQAQLDSLQILLNTCMKTLRDRLKENGWTERTLQKEMEKIDRRLGRLEHDYKFHLEQRRQQLKRELENLDENFKAKVREERVMLTDLHNHYDTMLSFLNSHKSE